MTTYAISRKIAQDVVNAHLEATKLAAPGTTVRLHLNGWRKIIQVLYDVPSEAHSVTTYDGHMVATHEIVTVHQLAFTFPLQSSIKIDKQGRDFLKASIMNHYGAGITSFLGALKLVSEGQTSHCRIVLKVEGNETRATLKHVERVAGALG